MGVTRKTFVAMALEPVPDIRDEDAALLLKLMRQAELCPRACWPDHQRYIDMGWIERRAWIAAARKLDAIEAQRAGLATLGPLGAAMAGAEADGGEAAAGVFLSQQVAEAIGNIQVETQAALHE